ncbi:MAG: acyltransferase family protein [Pseudomonadota bacterium]
MKPHTERLFFLDWVRIAAFLVLILYHVGMYYVTWDWHVKSPFASDAIEPFMMLSSPWRLGLLFLISGVASSFLLAKLGAGRFMRQRSVRLLVPLIFGMLVIVPPQPYFEVVEKVAYAGSYGDFMKLYVSGFQGFCREDCLDLPTWNHLWFVAYLWVYTLAFGALLLMLGARFDAMAQRVAAMLSGWKIIVLPALAVAGIRVLLFQHFPTTHDLVNDWFNHAHSFMLFMLGAMLARQPAVWARIADMRWMALGVALGCWASLIIYYSLPEAMTMRPELQYWRVIFRVVYAFCAWNAIAAVCGFAHQHLNFDSPKRRYLTEAVFPVYILHQTLIVTIAHLIKPAKIAPATEGLLLIVLTLCISFGVFEIVRRISVLRPFLGLGPKTAGTSREVPAAGQPATSGQEQPA